MRLRKRDALRLRVLRAAHAIRGADGMTKVALFLSLVFVTWIVFFAFPHILFYTRDGDMGLNASSSAARTSNSSSGTPPITSSPMKPERTNERLPPSFFSIRVVSEYPHDRDAFTQGLELETSRTFLESTGLFGRSTLRRVDVDTGKVLQSIKLPDDHFGEGCTAIGDRIYVLTWKLAAQRAFPIPTHIFHHSMHPLINSYLFYFYLC